MKPETHLPRRIRALFELVSPDAATVAEIGYDHGKLIVLLAGTYQQMRIIGIELLEDAGRRFSEAMAPIPPEAGRRIDLRVGDGLQPLLAGEAGTLVMAGFGEGNMIRILQDGREKIDAMRELIFMPSHAVVQLRHTLREFGWVIAQEKIAFERGRYYLALRAVKGSVTSGPESPDWWFGPPLLEEKNPFLYAYLLQMQRRFSLRLEHLDKQTEPLKTYCSYLPAMLRRARAFAANRGKRAI